jgi:tryptophanyl-tRNA synthetase
MSASEPETSIFTTDTGDVIKRKIWNAFTGGKATVKKQKKEGGVPDICTIFQYFAYIFETDDKKLAERKKRCKSGEILCGECKTDVTKRITSFLLNHQKKREAAKKNIDKFRIKL